MRRISLSLLALLSFSLTAFSQASVQADTSGKIQDISAAVMTSFENAEAVSYRSLPYQKLIGQDLKAGYSSKNIWIKISLDNSTDKSLERVIYFTSALVGRLELYDDQGSLGQMAGGGVPLVERSLKTRLPGFLVNLPAHSKKDFYIKRISHHSLSTRLAMADLQTFLEEESGQKSYFFLYIGGIGCLILFNFLIGLYTVDKGFLYYSIFAMTLGATICVLHGVVDSYFLGGFGFVFSDYLMCFSALSVITALAFTHRFLHLSKYLPRAIYFFWTFGCLAAVVFVEGLLLHTSLFWDKMGYVTDLVVGLTLVSLITAGVMSLRLGGRVSKFFLMSWAFLFAGVSGYFGALYGLLPSSALFNHGLLFGSLVEMVVISLGLAYKLNILDIERRQALESAAEKEHYHRLVKVLSHDVSNAMAILSGYFVRIQRRLSDAEDQPMLSKMGHTIQKMNEILGMVKKEEAFKSFKESIELRAVSLHEVVAEVLYFYQDPLENKNLKLKILVPENIEVYADHTALAHQVISNIISNSIKFSKSGGTISIFVEEQAQSYRLVFEDQGVGIPKNLIEKIFFSSQAFSTEGTQNEKGSGLGSSLIREYMELFQGRLEVQSSTSQNDESETGTKVILVFPKIPVELNA